VLLQTIRLRESLPADVAGERVLAGVVGPHVVGEVAAVGELAVAHDARVALLAGVCDHVPLQRRRVDESLGADRAHVRSLARVGPHVLLEQVRPRVLLAADLTRERPFAGVYKHVPTEDIRLAELHAALLARVVLVGGVLSLVLVQRLDVVELLVTDATRVRAVNVHVTLQHRWFATLHRTQFARVDRLSLVVLHCLGVTQRQRALCNHIATFNSHMHNSCHLLTVTDPVFNHDRKLQI